MKRFFSPQKDDLQKKKEKKVFTEIETDFSAEIGNSNVFSAQKQLISKKKKVFAEIETDFSAKIGNSNAFSGRITTCTSQLRHPISFGGAVFIFLPKIGLKSTKNVRFCILHKPMGGSSPPPPPLATLLGVKLFSKTFLRIKTGTHAFGHFKAIYQNNSNLFNPSANTDSTENKILNGTNCKFFYPKKLWAA